jgi:hypothetical protein
LELGPVEQECRPLAEGRKIVAGKRVDVRAGTEGDLAA